ncbi:MAG: hypothetical protein GY874_01175 [Desulfobacteraceae bacterium]|nr:hypothetical protein [Desulfobacteraceae bacterium]
MSATLELIQLPLVAPVTVPAIRQNNSLNQQDNKLSNHQFQRRQTSWHHKVHRMPSPGKQVDGFAYGADGRSIKESMQGRLIDIYA